MVITQPAGLEMERDRERERLWAEVFGFAVRAHPERLGLRG